MTVVTHESDRCDRMSIYELIKRSFAFTTKDWEDISRIFHIVQLDLLRTVTTKWKTDFTNAGAHLDQTSNFLYSMLDRSVSLGHDVIKEIRLLATVSNNHPLTCLSSPCFENIHEITQIFRILY